MTIRQEEIDALRRVAVAVRAAGGGASRSGKSCSYCEGRLDRPPEHIQTPCKGLGCPGHELREALMALTFASVGPPYGVWVIPAAGETNWPDGKWAEKSTGSRWAFDTLAAAEDFAQDARTAARAHWRFEVRPIVEASTP